MRKALLINAVFSCMSGIILILFHIPVSNLFEIESGSPFWIVGVALIFFSLTIFIEIKRQRRIAILWIIVQDFLWVIGSLIILIARPFGISSIGNYLIAIIACAVLAIAINQSIALTKQKINR